MVKAVEEVETVVSDRLSLLEERLQQEKYNLHDRRVFHLESDIRNLLIFLRRVNRDKSWSTEGLTFHEIDLEKTLSDIRDEKEIEVAKITVEVTPESSRILTGGLEDISREVSNIREDIRNSTVIHTQDESYKVFEENVSCIFLIKGLIYSGAFGGKCLRNFFFVFDRKIFGKISWFSKKKQ